MRFLCFTTDLLPIKGVPTSGTALRTYGIINGLRAHGHEVIVSVPKTALSGFLAKQDVDSLSADIRESIDQISQNAFDPYNQGSILSNIKPDVILCGHWPAMALRIKPSQLLIIDLAGPHLLERHFQGCGQHEAATAAKLAVLATADYYIASGPSQRLYFLSFLMRAAVDRPEQRILNITMALPPEGPRTSPNGGRMVTTDEPLPTDYPRFIFGGIFLPWQDPSWALDSLASELSLRNQGKLHLIGGEHPNYQIKKGVYEHLFERLSSNPRVKRIPLLPYEDFVQEMCKADVALNLMNWNLERELAVTIRSTSYLWAGLPLIYDDYADLSTLIKAYDAGWCVAPGDTAHYQEVLNEIFSNKEIIKQKSLNALRLSSEVFAWDKAVVPLLEILGGKSIKRLKENDIIVDTPENAELAIDHAHPVQQYFVSRMDGLSKVEFRLATHAKKIAQQVNCSLHEVDVPAQGVRVRSIDSKARKVVAQCSQSVNMLSNNDWLALSFEPLPDSAGKTYLLTLSSETTSGETCSAWGARSNPYPMVELHHGNRKLEHTCLCLRTTCDLQC